VPRQAAQLKHHRDGTWSARFRLPADVQTVYKRLYGVSAEALWRSSTAMSLAAARLDWHAWRAKIGQRIEAIRKGETSTFTHEQARALSGRWYEWFVDRQRKSEHAHDINHWCELLSDVRDTHRQAIANANGHPWHQDIPPDDVHDDPDALAWVLPCVADRCHTAQFIHDHQIVLPDAASRELWWRWVATFRRKNG
jgi:hypothetical protein